MNKTTAANLEKKHQKSAARQRRWNRGVGICHKRPHNPNRRVIVHRSGCVCSSCAIAQRMLPLSVDGLVADPMGVRKDGHSSRSKRCGET